MRAEALAHRARAGSFVGPASAMLLGIAAFLLVLGPKVLQPGNLGWLGAGDPLTHFLGWQIFRDSPWQLPLGLNPRYGLEFGNSLVFSDSIPLLAIASKALSPLLPEHFQYFGVWLLACFVLQAFFAWKLLGLFIEDGATRLLGCAFFVFSPPMLWRMQGHLSLSAHFLVTAGLYLHFLPDQRSRALRWAVLLVACAAIHAYLLVMVAAIWGASLVRGSVDRVRTSARLAGLVAEGLGIPLLVIATCWLVGYFAVGEGVAGGGYGIYRMNLLGLVNPLGWSKVMAVQPHGPGDDEGFNFLGLGLLLVVLFCVPAWSAGKVGLSRFVRRECVLLVVLVALSCFAITNNVGIGSVNLAFPIPPEWLAKANVFRASGRVFWPVYYTIVVALLFTATRSHSNGVARVLLAVALVAQLADTAAGWRPLKARYAANSSGRLIASELSSPFWDQAATRYEVVRMISPTNSHPDWATFADFAAAHRMATDAVYLARVDDGRMIVAGEAANRIVETGDYDRHAIYIIDDEQIFSAWMHARRETDLVARIDGFNVVAPGWKSCERCFQPPDDLRADPLIARVSKVVVGDLVEFSSAAAPGRALLSGFWIPEATGRWLKGSRASVAMVVSGPRPARLVVSASALLSQGHPDQRVEFRVDGGPSTIVTLSQPIGNVVTLPLPPAPTEPVMGPSVLTLEMHALDAARPVDLGLNADTRLLSLQLVSIRLE